MTSAMTSCGDWLITTPAETKVEPFRLLPVVGLSEKTDPKSEINQCNINREDIYSPHNMIIPERC